MPMRQKFEEIEMNDDVKNPMQMYDVNHRFRRISNEILKNEEETNFSFVKFEEFY